VQPRSTPSGDMAWEEARHELALHARPDTLEAFEYVFDSPFVAAAAELATYARPGFAKGRGLLEAIDELSHRIHSDFKYQPNATAIDTPLLETLKTRRGVCQDFSHVMIGALRSLGLAARYVSGYLRSGVDYQGAEASHAWVSVYLPGGGWVDIDPTNDVRPATGHVTLGWGRDYGDVTPVKGIALGGGHHLVEVEVRVEPIDGEPSAHS
jgi:transglutaminase-like putative cysteine protease